MFSAHFSAIFLPSVLRPPPPKLFWDYFVVPYSRYLHHKYPKAHMRTLAVELINWELAIFSQLRKDLTRIGLGPFGCYQTMSSGMHGLFLSLIFCTTVDVYGFSLAPDGSFADSFARKAPSEGISWEFEALVVKLLHFAGGINVCTT
eukprot:jgi/Mesvir1/7556/Mv19298-RA.1